MRVAVLGAVLGAVLATALSACADLDRLNDETPPFLPPPSHIYSASSSEAAPESFVAAQSRAAEAMRKASATK